MLFFKIEIVSHFGISKTLHQSGEHLSGGAYCIWVTLWNIGDSGFKGEQITSIFYTVKPRCHCFIPVLSTQWTTRDVELEVEK